MYCKIMNNNHYHLQMLLFLLISIILCFNPAVTQRKTQGAWEEQESEEFRNALPKNVRDGYQKGSVELLDFITSINNTLAALNRKFSIIDNKLNTLNAKIEVGCNALNESIFKPETTQKAETDQLPQNFSLQFKTAYDLNKWEAFDSLIRTQAKEIKTGNSFNGSTLSDIKSRAAQVGYYGRHAAIVFVNHLDEAIGDFTTYQEQDHNNFMYTPAPNSVPGRTQEVFAFAPLINSYGGAWTSFSYAIPSFDIRVAAISYAGAYGVGLAFVPKGAIMTTYYYSRKGIEGSSAWECCGFMDRNLSVGYKNLYARMFSDDEEYHKTTLRIQLIKLPLDE